MNYFETLKNYIKSQIITNFLCFYSMLLSPLPAHLQVCTAHRPSLSFHSSKGLQGRGTNNNTFSYPLPTMITQLFDARKFCFSTEIVIDFDNFQSLA